LLHTSKGVAGTSGAGIVTAIGTGVSGIAVNDTVLVTSSNKGTWADACTVDANTVNKIQASIPAEEAAALPAALAAWALLNKYASLKSGDVVVQCAGESAVGLFVSQIGKAMGLSVVSVAAGASDLDAKLKAAGAIKLAITSSSGAAALALTRAVAPGGILVAYNGVVEPIDTVTGVTAPVARAIFEKTQICGFDFDTWSKTETASFSKGLKEVLALVEAKKLSLKGGKVFPQTDFAAALALVQASGASAVLKA